MARPRKEGLDYFPHDTDASSDEKIEVLRAAFGNDGYAFYFILLERIYRTSTFELDISAAEMRQILAQKCGVSADRFEQILALALKWKCFDQQAYEEHGVLTSDGIKRRANMVVEKRRQMRERYERLISEAKTREETGEEMPQRKEKKSKVKESTVKESTESTKDRSGQGPEQPSEPSPTKPRYVFTEEHMALAKRLADRMRENKPNIRLPSSLDAWANTARLMTDIDKRSVERIAEVIDWCQKDEFWRSNILSMDKLRKQFDRLEIRMDQEKKARDSPLGDEPPPDVQAFIDSSHREFLRRKEASSNARGS